MGKSTLVPGAVADQSWCAGNVLVSQPRRLAAQALARRVAAQRGTKLGGEVGYSVRFDRQVSAAARVEFVTAGLLLRRIQSDPFLDGVDCVILDEFHERSLDSDLSLALLLQVQAEARPDLRLVIMSATLDVSALERRLPDAAQVRTSGRSFPVEIEHLRRDDDAPIATAAARAALRALSPSGRVLVFLPGVGSIERCRRALADADVSVLPLHGRLSARAAARADTLRRTSDHLSDQPRPDEPDDRRRPHGGRQRARARHALRPSARRQPAHDGPDQPRLGGAARRAGGAPRPRALRPVVVPKPPTTSARSTMTPRSPTLSSPRASCRS